MNTTGNHNKTSVKELKTDNRKAITFLIFPAVILSVGLPLSNAENIFLWVVSQALLGIFFFQCFIFLHETGHYSFFRNKWMNKITGHLCGVISFIPFTSWVAIHNLHHKWTGYRDKDPTTEGTVSPVFSLPVKWLINISWITFFPLFTIGYRFGNYWSPGKLKKHLPSDKLKIIRINQLLIVLIYIVVFSLGGKWLLIHAGLAYYISLAISDIIILSQHSHIDIPLAGDEQVKPMSYRDQVQYTRSLRTVTFIEKYFLLNFNLHELHHAYPGIPAYELHNINEPTPNKRAVLQYLRKAKKMSGIMFVFNTTKNSGIEI
jgi:acyl-lipid omega-6 desaturase (Delta-12 desaturase)